MRKLFFEGTFPTKDSVTLILAKPYKGQKDKLHKHQPNFMVWTKQSAAENGVSKSGFKVEEGIYDIITAKDELSLADVKQVLTKHIGVCELVEHSQEVL